MCVGLAMLVLPGAAAAAMSLASPPPGANDFSCRPSAAHPRPVVLVHGLSATMGENWSYISPLLKARGYCVFALTYGLDPRLPYFGGVIPIEQSAPELAAFIVRVRQATRSAQVDLVGHSEGTFMPEYYLKYLGGARYVHSYVAMTPLYHGTNPAGLATLRDVAGRFGLAGGLVSLVGGFCGSCSEFLAGSPMVQKLNAGPDGAAVAGVQYTTIPTRYDELVVPYTSGILHAPNVTNHVLQDICPANLDEHVAEAFDPVVAQLIFNGLNPAHAQPVSCSGLPPAARAGTPKPLGSRPGSHHRAGTHHPAKHHPRHRRTGHRRAAPHRHASTPVSVSALAS